MVAQPQPPLPHEQPLHRSLNSRAPTGVFFANETGRTVQVVWLSYDGNPHLYLTLQPGASTLQYTYTAHPWCFRAVDDPAAVLTVGSQPVWYAPPRQHPPARACIREAPRQPWCPAQHQHTPPAFQASVRALLLSHYRLATGGAGAPPPPCNPATRLGGWAGRLRSALRWGARQSPPPPPESGALQADEARHTLGLGDLPEELLLKVVAAAAPSVPVLVKPAVPAGVTEQELSAEARRLLFRQEEQEEGSTGGGWRQQQRDVPAEQLQALLQQQEDPAPPPMAVHHPLQFAAAPAPPL